MFIPATAKEAEDLYNISLMSEPLDVILVTGDSYIDSPFIGISVIGQVLMNAGYKVGIIPQPDIHSGKDITRFGEPRLFWGVSAGNIDSMVANYTATKRKRKQDDFTAGGLNNRRPDRACIIYSALIRKHFKDTKPVVLGGLEASLRRIAHYDYWNDTVQRSVLIDAKADYLVYGMGEKTVLEMAGRFDRYRDAKDVRGLCYLSDEPKPEYLQLPSWEEVKADKNSFIRMFKSFYDNNDPYSSRGLCQKQDGLYLVQNPPAIPPTQKELDGIHALEFERKTHPIHQAQGPVRALETIRFSVATHRGCFGECNFCSITMHQGRSIIERSEQSILDEVKLLTGLPGFKGYILDVGGPTANMYGMECSSFSGKNKCTGRNCVGKTVCRNLAVSHEKNTRLLEAVRKVPGVKKAFVASGIRYDLLSHDSRFGRQYLEEIVNHHVSGQMKIAPEHVSNRILRLMNKPGAKELLDFKKQFDGMNQKTGKKQFLTYYFIAAHPGCGTDDMRELKQFVSKELKTNPEQVQIFMPTPSTWSTLMYYTGSDPFTGEKIFVERDLEAKQRQKDILVSSAHPARDKRGPSSHKRKK